MPVLNRTADSHNAPPCRIALFNLGFRPFFLLGAAWGIVALVYFILTISGILEAPPSAWDVISWHRHEMLFGFVGAIIVGFLFTAVPNWTGNATPKNAALAAIVALWLAGRIAVLCSAYLPMLLVGIIDASFFAVCAASIAPALIRSQNRRNYFFLILLALLAVANALTYSPSYADTGIRLALAIITMMLVIIGGRVIPFFTERRLGIAITRNPLIERLTLLTTIPALLLDVFAFHDGWTGMAFIAAAIINGWRCWQWQGIKTLRIPLLWVLHMGYGWLVLSFLLHAAALLGWEVPISIATHALTAGAMSGIILGMIARVSLGHTGRQLEIGHAMAHAFAYTNLAAAFRVFGIWILPEYTMQMLAVSTVLWALAFGLFLIIYTPMLIHTRVDGKDG